MKIALIGYMHGNGGAERQIIMLSNELAAKGHQVHLLALADYNVKYEVSPAVHIYDLSDTCSNALEGILHRYKKLKAAYQEIQPDVTVHYWLQSAYLTAFMPKSLRGKIIYSERGDPGDAEYSGALGYVRAVAFRLVDGFVFQSEGARDYFGPGVIARSTVIHNSVSVPEDIYTTPSDSRENRIVSIGRLHPQKNQALLIDGFAKIQDQFPEYTLEIYGDGELEEELQAQIDGLGLTDRIRLCGSCKEIFDRIYHASLFVLTSDFEGMPNALMEAMALGIPCISTDCKPGGARTLIQDGENGYIVPIGDADALAEKMAFLLTDREQAETVARNAQRIRVTNSGQEVFRKWNDFIQEL